MACNIKMISSTVALTGLSRGLSPVCTLTACFARRLGCLPLMSRCMTRARHSRRVFSFRVLSFAAFYALALDFYTAEHDPVARATHAVRVQHKRTQARGRRHVTRDQTHQRRNQQGHSRSAARHNNSVHERAASYDPMKLRAMPSISAPTPRSAATAEYSVGEASPLSLR